MANPGKASGGAYERRGRLFLRVTTAPRKRASVAVPWATSLPVALERARVVQGLVDRLREAGHDELVPKVVAAAAEQSPTKLDAIGRAIDGLLAGQLVPKTPKPSGALTFQKFAERWTSGELHREFPDHVRRKRSADDDESRLKTHVYPEIGARELASLTLEDALAVMRKLPEALSPATRRHVAQLLSRIFAMAVYPCRILPSSPLPRGFLPKLRAQKAKAALYPDEEAALLACEAVPLTHRMLYGFSAREGMRASEALRMTFADLDLVRGAVKLDRTKTDQPRSWALDPGTAEALRRWRALRGEVADDALVFGGVVANDGHLAAAFRAHLRAADVRRAELTEESDARRPIRFHDLRATLTTVALASGKSEAWVSARTGHRSSMQIAAYRRLAQQFSDVGAGWFANMAETVPELAKDAPIVAPMAAAMGAANGAKGRAPAREGTEAPRKAPVGRDRRALGSAAERREGSSPFPCTSQYLSRLLRRRF